MPGFELIAEFMLNELVLKYSDSLENCVLLHLKELFSRDGAEEDDEEMEAHEIAKAQEEMRLAEQQQQMASAMSHEDDDEYSEDNDADLEETPSVNAGKVQKASDAA